MPPKKKTVTKKTEPTNVVTSELPIEASEDIQPTIYDAENDEHVVLHLPILTDRLAELTYVDTILEYNPNLPDPSPYDPMNQFVSGNDLIPMSDDPSGAENNTKVDKKKAQQSPAVEATEKKVLQKCFWCCHEVGHEVFGMPIRYDALNKNFAMYGSFCSLECASAFNFSQHLGSDRVWEIHSWIQMLGKRFGYKEPIRPAPSRYLLQMFNGPLTIEEFRAAHKGQSRTLVMNIPPLISIPSQMELINTSFIGSEKKKPSPTVDKKRTIDTKMKLLIQEETT